MKPASPVASGNTSFDGPTTLLEAPKTVPDGPAPAPAQPPRILKKPAPFAPAPLDVVPRNTAVNAEDPTVVRRGPGPAPVAVASPPPIQTSAELQAPTKAMRPPPISMPSMPEPADTRPAVPRPVSQPSPSPSPRPQPPHAHPPSAQPHPQPSAQPSSAQPSSAQTWPPPSSQAAVTQPNFVPRSGPAASHAASSAVSPPASPPVSSSSARSSPAPAPTQHPPTPTAQRPITASVAEATPIGLRPPLSTGARAAHHDDVKGDIHAEATAKIEAAKPELKSTPGNTGATAAAPGFEPPARVVLDVTAGLGWIASTAIDAVVGGAAGVGAVAGALTAKGVRLAVQPIVDFIHASPSHAVALIGGALFLGVVGYEALTVLVLGGTVGQRLLGLRVLRVRDGARPGIGRTALRAVASAVGVVAFLAGPLWGVFLDKRRRGLGDLVARTVVARRRDHE